MPIGGVTNTTTWPDAANNLLSIHRDKKRTMKTMINKLHVLWNDWDIEEYIDIQLNKRQFGNFDSHVKFLDGKLDVV